MESENVESSNVQNFDTAIMSAVVDELNNMGLELFPIGYVLVVRAAQMNTDGSFDREVSLCITHQGQSPFVTLGLVESASALIKSNAPSGQA